MPVPWASLASAINYAAIPLLFYCIAVPIYRTTLHPLRKYPGPRLASLTEVYHAYFAYRQTSHRRALWYHDNYGPVVRVGPNSLLFNTVSALKAVHLNARVNKSYVYSYIGYVNDGEGILETMDKRRHRQRRRLLGAGLNDNGRRGVQPSVNAQVDIFVDLVSQGAKERRTLNMTTLIKRLTFDFIGAATFGYHFDMQTKERGRRLIDDFNAFNYMLNVYMNLPALYYLHIHSLLKLLDPSTDQKFLALLDRLKSASQDADFDLHTLIKEGAEKDSDNPFNEQDIVENTFFLIVAGPDTMAASMCATLFYLSRHRQAYDSLAREIRSTFSSSGDVTPGSRLTGCHYLRACIDESLRLSPPAAGPLWREQDPDSRKAGDVLTIDGHTIPPGTQFGVGVYALHHNEDYFPSPFAYRPERWLTSETPEEELKVMREAFTPFSMGARSCPGKSMAYAQMSLVIAKLLWHFDFETAPGEAGKVGLRQVHLDSGEVEDEYETFDIFVTKHDGPNLVFTAREGIDGVEL